MDQKVTDALTTAIAAWVSMAAQKLNGERLETLHALVGV
jgi:hypothetical protein